VLLCIGIAGASFVRGRARVPVRTGSAADADVTVEWPAIPRGSGGARPRRERVLVPLLAGAAAALMLAPWAGVLIAAVVVAVQWRPRLRAAVALAPAGLLGLVTVYIVYGEHHFRFPAVFEWPTLFPLGRPLAWLAVIFLGVDVFIERSRSSPRPGAEPPGP
jgi:hypothetical protein